VSKGRGIPSLTGIRGIAAFWVMLYHVQHLEGAFLGVPLLFKILDLGNGWRGVDLFFMLSGFILMHAHGRDFYRIHKRDLIRFAQLRFTRVYPLNAVVLLLITAFVAFQPGFVAWMRLTHNVADFSPGAWVRTLFLATRWFLPGSGDWNGPVWSLSLEIIGYAMFPLLAFFALRIARSWQLIGIALLSLAACSVALAIRRPGAENPIDRIAFVRMTSCFITGMAMNRLWTLTAESAKKWAGWVTAGSALGILVLGLVPGAGAAFNFLFAALLYGLAFQVGLVSKLLSTRFSEYLGDISFPIYLLHVIPLYWLHYVMDAGAVPYSNSQRVGALICWAAGCILTATFLHYYVEKPFHALGRRWAGARVPQQNNLAPL